MQITLVSSSGSVSDVLNRFEANFSLDWVEIKEEFTHLIVSMPDFLIKKYSICELKAMTDFLASAFSVTGLDTPKRNSKVSLAGWIGGVLLSVRKVAEVSGTIAPSPEVEVLEPISEPCQSDVEVALFAEPVLEYTSSEVERPQCQHTELFTAQNNLCNVIRCRHCTYAVPKTYLGSIKPFKKLLNAIVHQANDSRCLNCGLVHEPGQNTLCDYHVTKSEIEKSEIEKSEIEVYTISTVVADYSFSEERVNRLPPYLIDRKGNLLKKFWHRHYDAGYAEIVSEHLSNIARDSGLVIKLMAEDLEVSQACICGDPPPFIIDRKGAVYKRDRLKLSLAVRYAQVVSEYLSNIAVV
jgi:hypothetical protein